MTALKVTELSKTFPVGGGLLSIRRAAWGMRTASRRSSARARAAAFGVGRWAWIASTIWSPTR